MGFVVTDPPTPTDVQYLDNPNHTSPRSTGQGAQTQHMAIVVGTPSGSGAFVAGSGDPATYTHAVFTGLPTGVTITGETANVAPNVVTETFNVDPGASLASASIKLVNPDGGTSRTICTNTTTPNSCFLTTAAAPKVSTVSPSSFLAGTSGGSLILTGTNIDAGMQHVKIAVPNGGATFVDGDFNHGTGTTANQVTVTGISVPNLQPAGDADIILTNDDNNGVSVCHACFHVTSVDVTSVVPNAATGATNDAPSPITINGDNFASDATFSLQQVGVPAIPVTGQAVTNPGTNGSHASGTVDLTGVAPGFYDVVATNKASDPHAGTGVCVQCFRVLANAPTATNVSPTKAGGGASDVTVTLTGTNIFPGAQMSFSSSSITLLGDPVVAADHKSITQHISVAANAASEVGSVTVTNTDGQHPGSPLTFTVDPAPVVNTIAPTAHANGTSFPLTITGSGFSTSPLPTVTFSNGGVTGTVQSVSNAGDSITVSATIANNVASSAPVTVHVTVTNPDHGVAVSPTDLTVDPQPTFDHLTPNIVKAGGSVPQLQIFGTGFLTGATVAPHSANSGLNFGTVTVASPTEIDVPLTVDQAAAKGARTIDITNTDGGATTASITVITVPSVPQTVTATPGARAVTVDWAAPADNGGSALTSYTITLAKQGSPTTAASFTTSNASTLEHTFTQIGTPAANLENNTTYIAQVVATNAAGNSAAAPANGATATTYALPKAPSSLTATGGVRTVDLSWPAVTDAGNDPAGIASYTVTLVKHGADPNTTQTFVTPDGSTLSHQFAGLVNGTTYDATVRATNAAGGSPTTGASATTFDVPSAPSNVNAVPVDGQLAVTWNAPSSTGGTPLTGYTITLTPSGGDSPATTTS
ncbi:MAG: fibronectin type III domain-containing protein, partial [Frankiaceae bacterium]|nr:fibronectin type III domain-containing protein [Frankiaceae bacterium]